MAEASTTSGGEDGLAQTIDNRNIAAGAVVVYALVLASFLVAAFFPQARFWGINWYAYFPWPYAAGAAIVGIIAAVVLLRYRDLNGVVATDKHNSIPCFVSSLLLIAILAAAFYFFQVRSHFLGDGYLLLTKLMGTTSLFQPWQTGPFAVQQWLYELLNKPGPAGAGLTFQIISWGSGILFAAATMLVAGLLFARNSDRLIFSLGVLTGGYMLLFFGYVENYPLFVLSVALFMLVGLLITLRGLNRWYILPPLLLAAVFHPFAIALLPGAAYLFFAGTPVGLRIRRIASVGRGVIVWATAAVLVAVFVWAYLNDYSVRLALVPLVPDRLTVDGYWLFSDKHVLDYLNLLMLLLPGLPLLVILLLKVPLRRMMREPEYRFMILTVVPSLVLVGLFDPKLGMGRDWDLMSFAGVPLVCFFYRLALDRRFRPGGYRVTAGLAIVLSVLLLIPRVATQVVQEKGIAVYDNLVHLDKKRNRTARFVLYNYLTDHGREAEVQSRIADYEAELPYERWAGEAVYYGLQGKPRAAIIRLRDVVATAPHFSAAWTELGVSYSQLEQYDSAMACLRIADALNPRNHTVYNNFGKVYYARGDLARAEEYWNKAIQFKEDVFDPYGNLLLLYTRQGRDADYARLLTLISERATNSVEFETDLAEFYLERNEIQQAASAYSRALAKGLDSAVVKAAMDKYPELRLPDTER